MLASLKDRLKSYQHVWKQGDWTFFRLYNFLLSAKGRKKVQHIGKELLRTIFKMKTDEVTAYQQWISGKIPSIKEQKACSEEIKTWADKPLLSVIVFLRTSENIFLEETVQSLKNQLYTDWEVLFVSEKEVSNTVIANSYTTLKKAIEAANGEWIITLRANDVLTVDAFYHLVKASRSDSFELLYTDEDKINGKGEVSHPFFKPDWSPDTLLSRNYIGDFVVYKKSLLHSFLPQTTLEKDALFDLLLHATEHAKEIKRIPKVLLHSRVVEQMGSFDVENRKAVIEEALVRRGEKGSVQPINEVGLVFSVRYSLKQQEKISIIIPTKNKADILGVCLESIFTKSTYSNFEVIVLDNNSDEASFFAFIEEWKQREPNRLVVQRVEKPFNFSYLMNVGASLSTGEYLLLLNNDTEVLSNDWLEAMMEQAQRPSVGVVGARLLFPNNTLQHGGMIVGLGGIAAEHIYLGASVSETGYHYSLKAITNYSALTAACFMCRKTVFNEVLGFDEQLEVECNDVDFCLKVHEAGYNNIYLPHVELYHYESISRGHPMKTKESYAKHKKEINYFRSKWMKYIDNDPYYNPNLSLESNQFRLNLNSVY